MAGFTRRTLLPNRAGVSGTRIVYPLTTVTCSIEHAGSSKSDTSADFAMWGEGVGFIYNNRRYWYYTVYYATPISDTVMWDQGSHIPLPRFANYASYGCAVATIDRQDTNKYSGISHLDATPPFNTYGPGISCDLYGIPGVGADTAVSCRINVTASAVDVGYGEPYTGWIKVS